MKRFEPEQLVIKCSDSADGLLGSLCGRSQPGDYSLHRDVTGRKGDYQNPRER